ncbi:MAG: hypothetical protein EOP84_03445 [Verrucomicrobiaceae bacterium]|nr:MAG: hypothetical protein EOP84_03445 [Verrucomicrobiaceae bacterium]
MFAKSRLAAACLLTISAGASQAATSLSIGDITILGYSSDGTDQFAFVAWKTLDANTSISFTDRGWRNSVGKFTQNPSEEPGSGLSPADGNATWTSGVQITAGTVIIGTLATSGTKTISWNIGTSTGDFGSTGMSSVGESIFAYTGAPATPTLIFGLYYSPTSWTTTDPGQYSTTGSNLPTALNVPNGSIWVGTSTAHENGYFSGGFKNQEELLDYRARVLDKANWTVSNDDATNNLSTQFGASQFETIPEPSVALLGLAGLLPFLRRRR